MKKLLLLLVFMGVYANAQIVNIPDANFKAKLLSASASNQIASTDIPVYDNVNYSASVSSYTTIDTNGDGEIQVSEAQLIKYLNINCGMYCYNPIYNMTGIESFTNLYYLNMGDDNRQSYLDLSNNIKLEYLFWGASLYTPTTLNFSTCINLKHLYCAHKQLTTLNIANCTNLVYLDCLDNLLTTLDISNAINLKYLNCSYNQLSNLDVTNLTNLKHLELYENQISTLNVSNLVNLEILNLNSNQIPYLDTTNLTSLLQFQCYNNHLTTLDFSNSQNLYLISCQSNQMTYLNLKNANIENSIYISNNPNLNYICVDDAQISQVQSLVTAAGYTNCQVNSYCSFTPGGTYYTINGANHYDENNNGCDAGDIVYPNLKINITNGTDSGSLIGNTTGNYTIPVQAGTHTLTPQLENPSYFTISPATSTNVTFPTQASPFTQDYCMTANGTHHDLEVTMIPINVARPGFDANYKIIYKNKGTNTETATLNFNYDDAVLDFVSATTMPSTQNLGNLVWSLGTVAPFQSGEITITLNLNSPTETPPLNAGSVLNYSAIINGAFTDETPIDNTFNLPQNVVNSYDPNDKTCLEGQTISNSMIGQYVHYMIRFENTGTYPAQNIVVKDMIDTAKFDVSTLQMTKASHNCYTRINGNKVEFIFENINLPFDDANNDGYVVFKIKTLPTLAQNSSVSNTADIFFDYNFPITTNTATTNFANLTTQNVTKAQVSVYPNPAKNSVNIKSENEINSISIFDIQGRQVQTKIVGATETSLDISNLQQGNYLLKINTNKGIVSEKIVKE